MSFGLISQQLNLNWSSCVNYSFPALLVLTFDAVAPLRMDSKLSLSVSNSYIWSLNFNIMTRSDRLDWPVFSIKTLVSIFMLTFVFLILIIRHPPIFLFEGSVLLGGEKDVLLWHSCAAQTFPILVFVLLISVFNL